MESSYHAYGPSGVIDFAPPHLACAYGEPSIYAQAGFPGYQQPLGYQYSPQYPAPVTYPASYPLSAQAFPMAAPPLAAQEEPVNTKELHERINSKIDSIISSQRANAHDHKADLLGSQIERLTRKVQKLSASMEKRREDEFCHALGAETKVNNADSDDDDDGNSGMRSRMRDNDIANRLRRLAAESKMRERQERVPDW